MVLIPVTVTDPLNRFVTGLEQEAFKIFEDKAEQKIVSFGSEDAPLSIGIVFDTSGSMGPKLEKSRQAVAEFFKTANPEDEAFLVEFNDRPELVTPFTHNLEEIQNRLTFTQSKGRTALLDGILSGAAHHEESAQPAQGADGHFRRRRQQQPLHGKRNQKPGEGSRRPDLCHRNL